MSYHRYDLPRQPMTPLDRPVVAAGVALGIITLSLVALLLMCSL